MQQRYWHNNSSGFSLVEIAVTMSLVSIGILAAMSVVLNLAFAKLKASVESNMMERRHSLIKIFKSTCGWQNTLQDPDNVTFDCLRDGTDCTGVSGAIQVRNSTNAVVYNGLSATSGFGRNNELCATYDGMNGNPNCPLRLNLTWEPLCTGGCINPQIRIIGSFNYAPGVANKLAFKTSKLNFSLLVESNRIQTSCLGHFNAGSTTSGMYFIDPDGAGGECPFEVYCDMVNDGGGWTLVASAPYTGYASLPETTDTLLPSELGRLSDAKFELVMQARDTTTGLNNAKVRVVDGATYQVSTLVNSSLRGTSTLDDASCAAFDAGPQASVFSAESYWGIYSAGAMGGLVGLEDTNPGSGIAGYHGFICDTCTQSTCGLAIGTCCSSQLVGSAWIR